MKPMITGPIDDAEDDRPQRAAIAQRVLELLADDDGDLPQAAREASFVRSALAAGERHERVLEVVVAGLPAELVGRAARHDAARAR